MLQCTSQIAMDVVNKCGYELVPHPRYSPDLAPSDYHLFGNLKEHLGGRRLHDNNELTGGALTL